MVNDGDTFLWAVSPLAMPKYCFIEVSKYISRLQYRNKHKIPQYWKEFEKSLGYSFKT